MADERLAAPSNEKLAQGLSHELAIVNAAHFLVSNGEADIRSGSFDDLINYVHDFYGLDRDTVTAALDIAEARVLREMESNGET